MVKLKSPLVSLKAVGRLGNITFLRRRHTDIAEKTPIPPDVKSLAQLSWRHMYQKAVALWHALSAAEKLDWESQARSRHMTGFAWFMSQALKPNPGLYLPLQGGTMTGDIDMSKNRILKLPLPSDSQEPASKAYVDAAIIANSSHGAYTGNNTANRAIPHGLGKAPTVVIIFDVTAVASTGLFHLRQAWPGIHSVGDTYCAVYALTVPDSTNFYVGNAANYARTANEGTTPISYYWVAIG